MKLPQITCITAPQLIRRAQTDILKMIFVSQMNGTWRFILRTNARSAARGAVGLRAETEAARYGAGTSILASVCGGVVLFQTLNSRLLCVSKQLTYNDTHVVLLE